MSVTRREPKPFYLRTPEAAAYVRLSIRTLEKHRYCGTGPVFLKVGGRVLYAREALDAWVRLGQRRSTFERGSGISPPARRLEPQVRR